jgi:hypothetical protein
MSDPEKLATCYRRLGESSSWASLAGALWGGAVLLPAELAGTFGLPQGAWQAIIITVAMAATLRGIFKAEAGAARGAANGNPAAAEDREMLKD